MDSSNYTNNRLSVIIKKINNFFGGLFTKSKNSNNHQTDLDRKLVYSLSKSRVPNLTQLKYITRFLNKSELLIFRISIIVLLASAMFLGTRFYITHLQISPAAGGEYIEGLIGVPKYINPLYAATDVDNDIGQLVFSSLFKRGPRGELTPDLATDYSISPDAKSYTIKIRSDALWHDGSRLTVDDIIFTFNAIQDPAYKSPLHSSFGGVDIEKVNEDTVKFNLSSPYAPFLDLLNFGILPQQAWSQIEPDYASLAELNLKPIGSGPYKIINYVKDKLGNIKTFQLESNSDYYRPRALIDKITFKFYTDFTEAIAGLNQNAVDGISYLPAQERKEILSPDSLNFNQLNLPQLTAIFFNSKNNPALADKRVRQALALAINKNDIVANVLSESVRVIDGPILPDSFAYNQNNKKYKYSPEEAAKLIAQAGWEKSAITKAVIEEANKNKNRANPKLKEEAEITLAMGEGEWLKLNKKNENSYLVVKLTSIDSEENKKITDVVKKGWESLGVKVATDQVPANQIQTDIIRTRNFDALFYGQTLGADPDVYAFWHSSQSGSNGLNISDYANKEVDQLLEDARVASSTVERRAKYIKFQEILTEDEPAIFMYSPSYTYVQAKALKGFDVKSIILPKDRFSNITEWYVKTKQKIKW